MIASHAVITNAEANSLAQGLVSRSAAMVGARCMILKGRSLEAHALRVGHSSGDSDVLSEPDAATSLSRELRKAGWEIRGSTEGGTRITHHSISLVHEGWPVDIDLHTDFPGLLVGQASAFEILWAGREQVIAAGHPVWIPDRASSIVIWALHSLRGTATQARHAEELRQIREVVLPNLSEAERQELADRIVELGADEPLRVVPEFAEIIGGRHGPQAPGALEAWNAKVAQAHEASPWLQVLRDARPGERPWLLFRAVWPSAHDLRLMDEALVDTPLGRVQSRGRRAWRLVRRIVERRLQAH